MEASDNSRLALLLGIFLSGIGLVTLVYINMPQLTMEERESLMIPKSLDDAKVLGRVLSVYKDKYHFTLLAGIAVVYVFLQSFAIPGSIFLSILSGFLFQFPIAILLVCTCSALGACICYLLSFLVGKRLVLKYWPERVRSWSEQVCSHREHLFWYIIFLRITPFLPNWFINLAAPVINVPLGVFFWGTFFGVAPPSMLFIQAGHTLYSLTSTGAAVSWASVAGLALCALLSLAPVIFKTKLQSTLKGAGTKVK